MGRRPGEKYAQSLGGEGGGGSEGGGWRVSEAPPPPPRDPELLSKTLGAVLKGCPQQKTKKRGLQDSPEEGRGTTRETSSHSSAYGISHAPMNSMRQMRIRRPMSGEM